MKKISIPEPCHENWADFTPTEKGAFCGSCATDVIDFSNKTPFEVKSILAENAGKHMCGRFKKSQLDELNQDYVEWDGQTSTTFRSKFLFACLIAFGMTLFTGCSIQESSLIQQFLPNQTEQNYSSLQVGNDPVDPDSLKIERTHLKGKVAYNPPITEEPILCVTPPDSLETIEIMTMGDIAYDPDEFVKGDTIFTPPVQEKLLGNMIVIDTTEIPDTSMTPAPVQPLFDDQMIDGLMMYIEEPPVPETTDTSTTPVPVEPIDDDEMIRGNIMHVVEPTIPETKEVIKEPEQNIVVEDIISAPLNYVPEFHAKLYPNPTADITTIELNVEKKGVFDIYLYAIDGKKVKSIYKGVYAAGIQRIVIDLSAYQAGSYLVVINGEKQKESLRLEKVK